MDSTVNISHLTQNGYIFKDHSHHVITFPIQFLIYQKTNRCPKHLPLDPDVCYFLDINPIFINLSETPTEEEKLHLKCNFSYKPVSK